jgi:hypothetical protein
MSYNHRIIWADVCKAKPSGVGGAADGFAVSGRSLDGTLVKTWLRCTPRVIEHWNYPAHYWLPGIRSGQAGQHPPSPDTLPPAK